MSVAMMCISGISNASVTAIHPLPVHTSTIVSIFFSLHAIDCDTTAVSTSVVIVVLFCKNVFVASINPSVEDRGISTSLDTVNDLPKNSWHPRMYATGSLCILLRIYDSKSEICFPESWYSLCAHTHVLFLPIDAERSSSVSNADNGELFSAFIISMYVLCTMYDSYWY